MEATSKDHENWGGKQWSSHAWMEPIIVLSIMFASVYFNRRKDYSILKRNEYRSLLEEEPRRSFDGSESSSTNASEYDSQFDVSAKHVAKRRNCCGMPIYTPNSSRFANHYHSRFLQKFPFLVEMFYWALNYLFYASTKSLAAGFVTTDSLWDTAQAHGIKVLDIEHHHWTSLFFPLSEIDVQQWFMAGHTSTLTFLNRAYSLVHIPGTVAFISWYYFAAPNHATFATARRTMTLCNFIAFSVFIMWPCMPPRLLPEKYGFHDTVRHDDATSLWQSGKYANQLAAMPSLHFAYAFTVGCTMIFHSGIFRSRRGARGDTLLPKSRIIQFGYVLFGICYPLLVLTVIVATANHYFLDAVAGTFVVLCAFLCNRVFFVLLPLEDIFCWVFRLEKPQPTTGENAKVVKRERPVDGWNVSFV